MRLDIYVNYRGKCEEAFRFYEQQLGGRVTSLVRHGEQPNPDLPADWKDKVLHARIEIGSTVLMGADIPNAESMRSAYLTLCFATGSARRGCFSINLNRDRSGAVGNEVLVPCVRR